MTLSNKGDENGLHLVTDRDEDLIDSLFDLNHPDYIKCVLNTKPLKIQTMKANYFVKIVIDIYDDDFKESIASHSDFFILNNYELNTKENLEYDIELLINADYPNQKYLYNIKSFNKL